MFRLIGLVLCLTVYATTKVDSVAVTKRIVASNNLQTIEFASDTELLTFNLTYFPERATEGRICVCYRTLETTDKITDEPCAGYGRMCIFHNYMSYTLVTHREKVALSGSTLFPQHPIAIFNVIRAKKGLDPPEITVTVMGESYNERFDLQGDRFGFGSQNERLTVDLFLYESSSMYGAVEIANVFVENPATSTTSYSISSTTVVPPIAVFPESESSLPVGFKITIGIGIFLVLLVAAIIVTRCVQGVWFGGYGIFAPAEDDGEPTKDGKKKKKKRNKENVERGGYFDPNAPPPPVRIQPVEPQSETDVSLNEAGSQPGSEAPKQQTVKTAEKPATIAKKTKSKEQASSSKKTSEASSQQDESNTETANNEVLLVKTNAANAERDSDGGHTKSGIKNRHYSQYGPGATTTADVPMTTKQKTEKPPTLVTCKDATDEPKPATGKERTANARLGTTQDKTDLKTGQERTDLTTGKTMEKEKALLNTAGIETAHEKTAMNTGKERTRRKEERTAAGNVGITQDTIGLGYTQARSTGSIDTMLTQRTVAVKEPLVSQDEATKATQPKTKGSKGTENESDGDEKTQDGTKANTRRTGGTQEANTRRTVTGGTQEATGVTQAHRTATKGTQSRGETQSQDTQAPTKNGSRKTSKNTQSTTKGDEGTQQFTATRSRTTKKLTPGKYNIASDPTLTQTTKSKGTQNEESVDGASKPTQAQSDEK